MNDETRRALELAREALNDIASWSEGPEVKSSFDEPGAARVARNALAAIDAARSTAAPVAQEPPDREDVLDAFDAWADAHEPDSTSNSDEKAEAAAEVMRLLSAPAAPVAQPVEWLRALLGDVMNFRHTPEGMVRGGEYVLADALIYMAALRADPSPAPAHTYASTQATNCAGCGEHKHTPLRIDAMGGYVCLTCIDKKLGGLLGEFGYAPASQPVSEPSEVSDADIDAIERECWDGRGLAARFDRRKFARAVLALRPAGKAQPLTDEQVYDLLPTVSIRCPMDALWFARAIERAHGIGHGDAS